MILILQNVLNWFFEKEKEFFGIQGRKNGKKRTDLKRINVPYVIQIPQLITNWSEDVCRRVEDVDVTFVTNVATDQVHYLRC